MITRRYYYVQIGKKMEINLENIRIVVVYIVSFGIKCFKLAHEIKENKMVHMAKSDQTATR